MLKTPSVEASFTSSLSCLRLLGERKHLSAISMKKDLCFEVRAASANRMHSAALLRNWPKLGKFAPISMHMGTDRAFCQKKLRHGTPLANGDRWEREIAKNILLDAPYR